MAGSSPAIQERETYYLLPTTYYLLPTTYYLLPTAYCLLPTPWRARPAGWRQATGAPGRTAASSAARRSPVVSAAAARRDRRSRPTSPAPLPHPPSRPGQQSPGGSEECRRRYD